MGAYNELGHYAFNGKRLGVYLTSPANSGEDIGDVWSILPLQQVVFQADKGLAFLTERDSVVWVPAATRITKAFVVQNRLFVSDENLGLMEYVEGRLQQVEGGERFGGMNIGALLDMGADGILVATITGGLYLWDGVVFSPWRTPVAGLLNQANVFCAKSYGQQELVFGTIQLGLVISDRKGNIRTLVNKDRGLNNNTVLSLEVDDEGNIWAGLDNGIARISYNSTISFFQ